MLRRVAPAIGLFFLSPFVGEFLLGNVAIDALPIGLVMAPMYGGVRSSSARPRAAPARDGRPSSCSPWPMASSR